MEPSTLQKHGVQISRRYNASPERVFEALVNPVALAKWFAPNDEMTVVAEFDPVPGGRYRVEMRHSLGNVHTVGGIYETVDAPNQLVFTWKWEGEQMGAMGESRVAISLKEVDGGTELTLVHDGFPAQEMADQHKIGWTGILWRLERLFGESALQAFSVTLALNRKLFANALDGISADQLKNRPTNKENHLLWIAGHLAHTRSMIAQTLGATIESPLEIFNEALNADTDYPGLDEIMDFYKKATHEIIIRIPEASAEMLASDPPFPLPISDQSIYGMLTFLAQHEAYHVGQMGLLRKQLGFEATSYADRTNGSAA